MENGGGSGVEHEPAAVEVDYDWELGGGGGRVWPENADEGVVGWVERDVFRKHRRRRGAGGGMFAGGGGGGVGVEPGDGAVWVW